VAWGVRFPAYYEPGGYTEPRHPSQIYEALTEGLLLFFLLLFLSRKNFVNQRPGLIAGVFLIGYSIARIFCELFREPDHFLGFIGNIGALSVTQGMALSVPPMIVGCVLIYLGNRNSQNSAT
jgi:phosphatidylglycerol:prolipoprotein diacylglycerol transferase